MTPTQAAEESERMEYSMYNPNTQNFKMFQQGEEPVELGGTMNVGKRKQMPIKLEPKKITSIPVETPEPTIRTR